jgi:iron(III) transport system permease protein
MASRAPGLTMPSAVLRAPPGPAPRRLRGGGDALPFRIIVLLLVAAAILAPVGLIAYQSMLDGPFFDATAAFGLDAWSYVLTDPDFWSALRTTATFSIGMTAIAVPLGAGLAFLLTRTDIPGRAWIEPLVLVPMFLSSIVLAFGYTVSVGPSGFVSLIFEQWFGFVP